ncbi:hypothetical protein BD626DRAFT_481910 [Schizophyllum amplum]|uniref:Uncharacterized protein n=1 Tax=Schizophyllum amplum TaxID=97359 RepID=A0A550CUN8_9AGAR|nr:hypothetical protein BD626DRAFT_481910 [Auriculariopsis ampla]
MSRQVAPLRDPCKVNYDLPRIFDLSDVTPTGDESIAEIVQKSTKWRRIIEQGASLAVAFGMLDVGGSIDYEREAMRSFTQVQAKLYGLWKQHRRLPEVDWANDRMPRASSVMNNVTVEGHTRTLRDIYQNDSIDEENTVFWTHKYVDLIPLLKAVDKVHSGARNAKTHAGQYDPRALQEMLAARKANKISSTILNRHQRAGKCGSTSLTKTLQVNLVGVRARAKKAPH